jgi:hypothetical protein
MREGNEEKSERGEKMIYQVDFYELVAFRRRIFISQARGIKELKKDYLLSTNFSHPANASNAKTLFKNAYVTILVTEWLQNRIKIMRKIIFMRVRNSLRLLWHLHFWSHYLPLSFLFFRLSFEIL